MTLDELFLVSELALVSAFVNLFLLFREGRAAYRSANNVICVSEEAPLSFITYVVDKARNEYLHVEHRDQWILQAVQNDSLEVTSDGLWADPATTQINLTPRGDVRLVSREPSSQASRIQPFDVFQGAPPSDIDLPRPHTVDLEERVFLPEVARSAYRKLVMDINHVVQENIPVSRARRPQPRSH